MTSREPGSPTDPIHVDELAVRTELTRVFDICHECRRCVDHCATFPTLFELIERRDGGSAGDLTPDEQDRVVDTCFQCTRCTFGCPYLPGRHERAVDVPRLVSRATAMRSAHAQLDPNVRRLGRVLVRTDRIGRVSTRCSGIANRVVRGAPGSLRRRLASFAVGVSATRALPAFASERFSSWFARRPRIRLGRKQGSVTLFPTCLVEYQAVGVGKDLVRVFERNGVECDLSSAGCCGAPVLQAGDLRRFRKIAERNVGRLVADVRSGKDVVVPQPTCSLVLRRHYPDHVGESSRPDAELVAEHVADASEYLVKLHQRGDAVLDTEFVGDVPSSVAYHAASHLRAQDIGFPGRDLMRLTGARVEVVQQCSGVAGLLGLRSGLDEVSEPHGSALEGRIGRSAGEMIAGDCHLSNTVISARTGRDAVHPLQVMARAYGIPED